MKKYLIVFLMMISAFSVFARNIEIAVGAGEHWKQQRNPQIAIWLEDENDRFIKTIYITDRAAKKNWFFAPIEGRPESLPVYYHSLNQNKTEQCDVVSSATPKGGFNLNTTLHKTITYKIKAEFNNSFDYNDTYTKKNSGVNGQPSVVYCAEIPVDFTGEVQLQLLGIGSIDGSDGLIHKAVGLTTAKEIVKSVSLVVL